MPKRLILSKYSIKIFFRKLVILYDNSVYVGYDNYSATGHDHIRTEIIEKIKQKHEINYIKINELKFNNSLSDEKRLDYLNSLGLNLN